MSDTRTPNPYLVAQEEYRFPPATLAPPPPLPRQRLWLHVLLFLLTIATTVLVGGWVFSASLLSILTAHEFGHYFAARHYRVRATLPYFIPIPLPPFGTMGAVIRMSSHIPHRRALFDIAAAGPLAGLVVAIPVTYYGITLSEIISRDAIPAGSLSLGEPLLFQGLSWLAFGSLGDNVDLLLHPLAYAGWAGLFVTAFNLLPMGQLDGGHISHSLFGSLSNLVAKLFFAGLALHSFVAQRPTWMLLLLLLLVFGVGHPPFYDDGRSLGSTRQLLGLLLGVVFITCFSLVPFQI